MTTTTNIEQLSDLVDAYRIWEKNHNRENYGRFDAYKAGYELAIGYKQALAPRAEFPSEESFAGVFGHRGLLDKRLAWDAYNWLRERMK